MYNQYPNGFVVHAAKNESLSPKQVVEYMTRYIARPVIAKKRILKHENKMVTFCYNRHEDGKYIEETIPALEFLGRLVIHIPDKFFNMVRYSGVYAKRDSKSVFKIAQPKWRERIFKEFRVDPCICACGKIMQHVTLFPNGP